MRIQNVNQSNTSFNGIKLSFNDIKSTRRLIKYLKLNGFECAGKKTYYVSNEFANKQKSASYIREHYIFDENEFGVLFLPWSREIYILSEPGYEQKMLEWVQEMDPQANINLIL